MVENCRPALLTRHFSARCPATFRQHPLPQLRSEADSNRCTRFCRPLPSHSAIRPNRRSLILRNIPDREYLETPDTPANPPCRQLRTIRSVLRLQIYKHFSFLQNLSGNFRFSLKNPYLYVEFHPSFSCLDKARIRSALRPA